MPGGIMLVDDNADFLAASRDFLAAREIAVIGTACSGREALNAIPHLNPRLLIADLAMPGMSGLELIRAVRAQWPQIRIIALTLADTSIHRQEAMQAGADDFIAKASMDTDLIPSIIRLLG